MDITSWFPVCSRTSCIASSLASEPLFTRYTVCKVQTMYYMYIKKNGKTQYKQMLISLIFSKKTPILHKCFIHNNCILPKLKYNVKHFKVSFNAKITLNFQCTHQWVDYKNLDLPHPIYTTLLKKKLQWIISLWCP